MRPLLIALGVFVMLGSVPSRPQADGLAASCTGSAIAVRSPVTIFGSYFWTLHVGRAILATSAQAGNCASVGVEVRPWATVKELYR